MNVVQVAHPLIDHHLSRLRDRTTPALEFRTIIGRLSTLLAFEATKDLRCEDILVETPLAWTQGKRLATTLGIVPILRAGLGMVTPLLDLLPDAQVWHLGYYRDETTLQPIAYYQKLPPGRPVDLALVLDPMLATGGSALAALKSLHAWGVKQTKLLVLIAAPEGIRLVEQQFPETTVYTCAVDNQLNEQGYIVPGLGDAGDRIFNAPAH